jgi:hypothetical protein
MAGSTTHTLEVPGAVLAYDVRAGEPDGDLPLFLIGSPMGAAGFVSLAAQFPDRTVVTYDPRGVERSRRTNGTGESTPQQHADDLSRLITELGGAADVFANSGGAVNALALVAARPMQVRTLVAHEPPLAQLLPDHEAALAACAAAREAYLRDGFGAGMARFIAIVSHRGPFTLDDLERPAPDPAMFGLPAIDDGSRDDALLGQNLMTCTAYLPDVAALRSASTRVVVGAGTVSAGELANRAAHALAERLGMEAVPFPSDHGGFLGGEYGQRGEPEAFALTLRSVL